MGSIKYAIERLGARGLQVEVRTVSDLIEVLESGATPAVVVSDADSPTDADERIEFGLDRLFVLCEQMAPHKPVADTLRRLITGVAWIHDELRRKVAAMPLTEFVEEVEYLGAKNILTSGIAQTSVENVKIETAANPAADRKAYDEREFTAGGGVTDGDDPEEEEGSLKVTVRRGHDGLVLLSDGLEPHAISADVCELFKLFVTKVAFGSPGEHVALEKLNCAVRRGVAPEDTEKASQRLRSTISRINRGLSEWCATPDGEKWIKPKRGKGYYLNHSLSWSIGDQDLLTELKRYSESVFSISVDPSVMAKSTPAKGQRLPSRQRRERSAKYHGGSDDE